MLIWNWMIQNKIRNRNDRKIGRFIFFTQKRNIMKCDFEMNFFLPKEKNRLKMQKGNVWWKLFRSVSNFFCWRWKSWNSMLPSVFARLTFDTRKKTLDRIKASVTLRHHCRCCHLLCRIADESFMFWIFKWQVTMNGFS